MNMHVSKQQPGHPVLLPKPENKSLTEQPETEGLTEPAPLQSVLHWAVAGEGWSQRPVKHTMNSCPISLLT